MTERRATVRARLWPLALVLTLPLVRPGAAHARDLPHLRSLDGTTQLIVRGRPFLILGGELGNSSAGTGAQADRILPRLARLDLNTVLMPVAWDRIEPRQGQFDFSRVDHWIEVARARHLHLMLLWFGSWKNAVSSYAPRWVLDDPRRFPRAVSAAGAPLPILSVFGRATERADARAFAALMRHLRKIDSKEQTVVMAQVENEVGYLGLGGRDRSAVADRLFDGPVPASLVRSLEHRRTRLPWRLAADFNAHGATWKQSFGKAADEVFMAWYYARYIDHVAEAGQRRYPLPMYMNAQLPAPHERAGEYPSGGPYPFCQPIYRAAAPAIDFYAPDIYWPDFERWVRRYRRAGNPAFVPESRPGPAPYNALYVFGQARGFGFSPFAVDSLRVKARPDSSARSGADRADGPRLQRVYAALHELGARLIRAEARDQTRALVLHLTSPRPTQTLALGGYLFRATLARAWHGGKPLETNGAMLVLELRPDVFDVLGMGLNVTFLRNPDADDRIAAIASVERMRWARDRWVIDRRLNGDQTNQGRNLLMSPRAVHLYRVRLYSIPRH